MNRLINKKTQRQGHRLVVKFSPCFLVSVSHEPQKTYSGEATNDTFHSLYCLPRKTQKTQKNG